jgi:hypothetical protein
MIKGIKMSWKTKCQCFGCHFSETNVRNPIIAKSYVLESYNSNFLRSNTRLISPQTCHMLPLDQVKHRSYSGTIQALNSFDFHE